MPRTPRRLQPGFCHHITVRCNNRAFMLNRQACREVLLYAIRKAIDKFGFRLYAVCIMSNHVHYLIEPDNPFDLPKIMHWLNWYTAMCFNGMTNRTGHFWEKRYHSSGFPVTDCRRALATLRYIHANPKTAGIRAGFFFDYSNYGIYDRLTDDGLTEWHPAFWQLGTTLDSCAARYRRYCRDYQPVKKEGKGRRSAWGNKLLGNLCQKGSRKNAPPAPPGQLSLWECRQPQQRCQVWNESPIAEIASIFILANRAGRPTAWP